MAYQGRTRMELYERSEMESNEGSDRPREVWKGLVSGVMAGLAASWIMTEYQVNAPKLFAKIKPGGEPLGEQEPEQQAEQPRENENPTIKVADAIAGSVAKRGLPQERRQTGGNLVHYGYGTLMGGLYGVLAELWPTVRSARGVGYGAVLFAAGDEIALPALGLAKWAPEYPLKVHAHALGAHLVYAFSLDSIYQGVCLLLNLASDRASPGDASRSRSVISEFSPPSGRGALRTPASRTETFGEEARRKVA